MKVESDIRLVSIAHVLITLCVSGWCKLVVLFVSFPGMRLDRCFIEGFRLCARITSYHSAIQG